MTHISGSLEAVRTVLAELESGVTGITDQEPAGAMLWRLADHVRDLDTALVVAGVVPGETDPAE